MGDRIEVRKGTDAYFLVTLKHETNATLEYTGSEARTCEVWSGDDRAVLFNPSTSWVEAPDVLEVMVATADLADLDPGIYKIRILLGTTAKVCVAEADLVVIAGPGSAVALPTYCDAEDLNRLFAQVNTLQDPKDRAGFEEQRNLARQWLDDLILASSQSVGYDPMLKTTLGGFGPNPLLKGWLDDGKLLISNKVRQACAHYALSLIFEAQLTAATDSKTDYSALADRNRLKAEQLVAGLVAEIDLNGDGRGDVEIPLFGTQALLG